jgi:hypothetical protein
MHQLTNFNSANKYMSLKDKNIIQDQLKNITLNTNYIFCCKISYIFILKK